MNSWIHKILSPWYRSRKRLDPKGMTASAENNPVIRAFLQDQVSMPETFNSTICENDEMYLFALEMFHGNKDRACIENLVTGKQSMHIVRQIVEWNFGGFEKVSAFLDFASGYGRLTRYLVQHLPPERIWVCDIYEDAITFQKKQFGVQGIVSVQRPEDFSDEKRYDCIFVGSLFSHLPEQTFVGWFRKLYHLLSPQGILVISVHDAKVLPHNLTMEEKGILFVPASESRSLDANAYGTAYVTEAFVRAVITEVTGRPVYHRTARGLWWFQDVYIAPKDAHKDFTHFDLSPGPAGYLDRCSLSDEGEVHFEGWAADFGTDTCIESVKILINGKVVRQCVPSHDRPDIAAAFQDDRGIKSGFACSLGKNSVSPSDIIIVKIVNNKNVEHELRIGTLKAMLD